MAEAEASINKHPHYYRSSASTSSSSLDSRKSSTNTIETSHLTPTSNVEHSLSCPVSTINAPNGSSRRRLHASRTSNARVPPPAVEEDHQSSHFQMKFATIAQVVHILQPSSSGTSTSSSPSSSSLSRSSFRRKSSKMAQATATTERQFIARFSDQHTPLPPDEVQQDPRNKELGRSSRALTVKDFDLVKTLGTGTFARVWLVRLAQPAEQDRDKVYALKVLRKADVIKLKQVDHVNHERAVLADVAGHPFITTLITSFSDHDSLYMLLDYCPGGEVFSYLRKAKRFDAATSRFYAAEIVLILEFLHEREGVAYRDLKPENLLLDAEGHIKLVDFGFAKRLGNRETYTLCGTPEYLAPEVIQSKGHTTAVDWWALGILIYEFLTGYPPFWHQNPIEIYKQIVSKPVSFPPHSDLPLTPETRDIIRSFCTVDRSQRLGNISGGAAKVKAHPYFKGVNWDDVYYRRCKGPIIPPIRYPGDSQCFDTYPDEKRSGAGYTDELRRKWDGYFADF